MPSVPTDIGPYFDDYDELKDFYRILFRPSFPVQARELTQIQSILQQQFDRFGTHIFKEGSMVIPGRITFDTKATYIKVDGAVGNVSFETERESNFHGNLFQGAVSGVLAQITTSAEADSYNHVKFFIKYLNQGTNGETVFSAGETLNVVDENGAILGPFAVAISNDNPNPGDIPTGTGSTAQITDGIYFARGYFLRVSEQQIILEEESDTPSAKVGLLIKETAVTPEEDPSLNDNAQGSSNFAAPGAHRLKIEMELISKTLGAEDDEDFIELLRLQNGIAQRIVQYSEYNILLDTLARRTYDESGDYTVRPFKIDVREYYNDGENNGVFSESDIEFDTSPEAEDFAITVLNADGTSAYYHYVAATNKYRPGSDPVANPNDPQNQINLMKAKYAVFLEPGKAFVRGYEIQTITKTLLVGNKARDFGFVNNGTITTALGNYVRVRNLFGNPDIKNYAEVSLRDAPRIPVDPTIGNPATANGNEIGTARIRAIIFHSGDDAATPTKIDQYTGANSINVTSGTAVYRLYLFDVQINSGSDFSQVKSITHGTTGNSSGFSCDIDNIITPLEGQIAEVVGGVATGDAGTRWVTKDSQRILEGDWINIIKDAATGVGTLCKVASTPTTDNKLNLVAVGSEYPVPNGLIDNANFSLATARLEDVGNNSLVFTLPHALIQTLRDQVGNVDTTYECYRYEGAIAAFDAGGGNITISLNNPGSDAEYVSFGKSEYILFDPEGRVLPVTSSNFNQTGPSVEFDALQSLGISAGESVVVISTVRRNENAAKEKTKTLYNKVVHSPEDETQLRELFIRDYITTTPGGGTDEYFADVLKINKITMSSDTAFSINALVTDDDITDYYELDTGQRDNHYGPAKLTLKKGYPIPSGRIRIDFDYFGHGVSKTFFSVDSYDDVDYEDIPIYFSKEKGITYNLRDCMDFRPRVNSTNTGFDDATGSLTEIIKGSTARADYSYFLNRIDKIFLDKLGVFHITEGVPELFPAAPESPTDGMVLYQLSVRGYTLDSNEIYVDFVENKRYTMRDIGKLENRIDNLEYYTSLSLLEADTKTFQVRDEEGLDRNKNGFWVEPFNSQKNVDVGNPDLSFSIDPVNEYLRPVLTRRNSVRLQPTTSRQGDGTYVDDNSIPGSSNHLNSGWEQRGDLITLQPTTTDELMAQQTLATDPLNVNPYSVFNFLGQIELNPASDEWKDTERAPDVVINQEGDFEAVKQLAEGIGTVWGEWETQWFGSEIIARENLGEPIVEVAATRMQHRDLEGNIDFPDWWNTNPGDDVIRWPVRHHQLQRITTVSKTHQTRRGVRAKAVPRTVRENIGEKVINVSYIPFMRTQDVVFVGKGFKPESRLYTFFDEVNVESNVISLPPTHEIFDDLPATDQAGNPLNLDFDDAQDDSELFPGVSIDTAGRELKTDERGQCAGVFRIPNTDALRFKTGTRRFLLTDRPTNDDQHTTYGSTTYAAEGLLETKQNTILATRTAEIVMEEVVDNEGRWLVNQDVATDIVQGPWVDPLAQSFLVDVDGGVFITKIHVYFRTKDPHIPVTLQVREMVNGVPGRKIFPFGNVTLNSDDVVTNDLGEDSFGDAVLLVDGVERPDLDVDAADFQPTVFEFVSPIYLQQGEEYCFVVMANSTKYEAWVATAGPGHAKFGTEIPILEQPYAGVLFKSQNNSTWSEDQLSDIKFDIFRAKYPTNTTAIMHFCNKEIPKRRLFPNPFEFRDGSPYVRVHHENHGHRSVNTQRTMVNLSGSDLAGTYFGIPASELIGTDSSGLTHEILPTTTGSFNEPNAIGPELDSYVIKVSTPAVVPGGMKGRAGGNAVRSTENKPFDTLYANVEQMVLPGTSISWSAKTTSGAAVHGHPANYPPPQELDDEFYNITVNQNIPHRFPRSILSGVNEEDGIIQAPTAGSKSFWLRGALFTENENITPTIDVQRMSAISIGTRIDDPDFINNPTVSEGSGESINFVSLHISEPGLDDLPILGTGTVYDLTGVVINTSDNTIFCAQGNRASLLALMGAGKYLLIDNTNEPLLNPSAGTKQGYYRIENVDYDQPAGEVTIKIADETPLLAVLPDAVGDFVLLDNFISETAPIGGSVTTTYISKIIQLSISSTAAKIFWSAYRNENSDIDLYYKVRLVDDNRNIDELPWVLADADYQTPPSQVPSQMRDYEYTLNDLPEFTAITVKIALKGGDPANPPLVQDLRVIALDA